MIAPSVAFSLLLTVGAPQDGRARSGAQGGRPVKPAPVRRIDRAHVVGAPVLDERARPGLYIWLEDGRFRFAVVGGRSATQFQVRANRPMAVANEDAMVWLKRGPRHYVGRSRSGRGSIATRGHIKVGRVRRGGRRVRMFVGPLAWRAASTVEIGAFGAVRR